MTNRETMQQALEALENHEGNYKLGNAGCDRQEAAITAIKEALAQPVQEPVALRDALAGALTSTYVCGRVWDAWNVGTMTQDDFQPAAECDELIDELVQAVAAAHGIKE